MPFHLESLWRGATLMPQRVHCDGLLQNKEVRVDKTSGQVLSRLWTKVRKNFATTYETLRASRHPCPIVCITFRSAYIRHKVSKSSRKLNKCKSFWPQYFFGRDDPNFSTAHCYSGLLLTVWQSVVEFLLLISVCEAWQWSGMLNLHRVGKKCRSSLKLFVDQSSWHFGTM